MCWSFYSPGERRLRLAASSLQGWRVRVAALPRVEHFVFSKVHYSSEFVKSWIPGQQLEFGLLVRRRRSSAVAPEQEVTTGSTDAAGGPCRSAASVKL